MNNTADQIAKLIYTPNPSAPITTHALAELGNGNMQNGLRRIASYYAAESSSNLRLGRIQGCLVGALSATATAGAIALIFHSIQKKRIESEGKVILNTLQKSANENIDIAENPSADKRNDDSNPKDKTSSQE